MAASMMGGRRGRGRYRPLAEINVTPLVDIMLVLLIIFIITIPVMTHAVKIDLPRDNPKQPDTQPEVVRIFVEFDGTVYWNGSPVDAQTLRTRPQA